MSNKETWKELRVAERSPVCSTRERGRRFYPELLAWLRAEASSSTILSFSGVDFVSPSFLDETVVRLAEESPDLARRVTVASLKPMAARRLKTTLSSMAQVSPVVV